MSLFDGFLCDFYGSQYGTDTDDNHQVKDIGTDDITDCELVVAGK